MWVLISTVTLYILPDPNYSEVQWVHKNEVIYSCPKFIHVIHSFKKSISPNLSLKTSTKRCPKYLGTPSWLLTCLMTWTLDVAFPTMFVQFIHIYCKIFANKNLVSPWSKMNEDRTDWLCFQSPEFSYFPMSIIITPFGADGLGSRVCGCLR